MAQEVRGKRGGRTYFILTEETQKVEQARSGNKRGGGA